jgi:hypothetical protein
MDENYLVRSGRINAMTYSHGDEEEADYAESPLPSSPVTGERDQTAADDAGPDEQKEEEVMDVDNNNTNTDDIPDILPDAAPTYVMHIDGVGYTAEMLSSAVAAQTADARAGEDRLRKAGWGTLLPSRSNARPALSPAPVPVEEGAVTQNADVDKEEMRQSEEMQCESPVGKSADSPISSAQKRALILALINPNAMLPTG